MTLSPGTRIGPYEISALIGAGGMGEVFRATDLNLGRSAAIKVLPQSLAADPDCHPTRLMISMRFQVATSRRPGSRSSRRHHRG